MLTLSKTDSKGCSAASALDMYHASIYLSDVQHIQINIFFDNLAIDLSNLQNNLPICQVLKGD